jgi:superoxide dismutase, Cu-Zn family
MKITFVLSAMVSCAVLSSCRPQVQVGSGAMPTARATVRNAAGRTLGVLLLEPSATAVHVTGTLTGLPAGMHGIHLHAVGKCDPPDFATAGAHFNPAGKHHGLENPEGPHAGDLPNITVNPNGEAVVDLTTPRVSLMATPPNGIFDNDGTAVVIHASPDDQRTDPSGNSGARIACGVVERS